MDVARGYVELGLRLDRLEPGRVDSYHGDPDLRREIDAAPPEGPAHLAARARTLLRELDSAGLPADREEYLRAQLVAVECACRRMAGEPMSYLDEIESYLQVRPELGDTDAYAQVHRTLDEVLPGRGDLVTRYAAYRRADLCPPDRLEATVTLLSDVLRGVTRAHFGLPAAERVEYRVVTDVPWSGFTNYLGGYRSRVAINADLPHRYAHLPHLVAHEAYPGHHTESCRKDRGLVGAEGRVEHTIHLVDSPECLVAEGLADLGVRAAIGPGWGRWLRRVLAEAGVVIDGELVETVADAVTGLDRVRQDAAIMLHELGSDTDEVVGYLCRWLLVPESSARESLRFVADPRWRAYTSTYVEGYRLLGRWLTARPQGQSRARRFARLLDEPLTPRRIATELTAAPAAARACGGPP